MKNMFKITVTLSDIVIKPKYFSHCKTEEEVLNEIKIICMDAYDCDEEAIQSIEISDKFWNNWKKLAFGNE